jgi:flagellar hook-basal body complex protein FliE
MIALQKADVSFRLLMQIRNKVVSAYETVMRMPI